MFITKLFLILFLCSIIIVAIIVNGSFKLKKITKESFRKVIRITFFALSPAFLIIYFFSVLLIGLNDHLDIKKNSPLWYVSINNTTIKNIPIVEPIVKPIFNHFAGDGGAPTYYQVYYTSKTNYKEFFMQIKDYLNNHSFYLQEVNSPVCGWKDYRRTADTMLFNAVSGGNGCLDLVLIKNNGNVIFNMEITE